MNVRVVDDSGLPR